MLRYNDILKQELASIGKNLTFSTDSRIYYS